MQSLCQRKAPTCALNTRPRLAPMMQGLALPHRHRLQGPAASSVCECVPRDLLISQPHPPSPMQFIHPAPFGFKLSLASDKGAAMPFPICFGPKRRAVVDLDPEPDNRQSELLTHPRRRPSGSSRARSSSSTTSAMRLCTCRVANMNYSSRQSTIVNRQGCKASTCVHDAMPRLAQELDLRPWRQAPSSGMHVECECPRHTPTVQGSVCNNKK